MKMGASVRTGTTSLTETELRYQLPGIITAALPGEKAAAILARKSEAIPPSLTCVYPIAIAKAEGAIIEDVDGNRFLDWVGGAGVLNIGHRHPKVVKAVKQQKNDYFHAMINILTSEKYSALADAGGGRLYPGSDRMGQSSTPNL